MVKYQQDLREDVFIGLILFREGIADLIQNNRGYVIGYTQLLPYFSTLIYQSASIKENPDTISNIIYIASLIPTLAIKVVLSTNWTYLEMSYSSQRKVPFFQLTIRSISLSYSIPRIVLYRLKSALKNSYLQVRLFLSLSTIEFITLLSLQIVIL